MCRYAHGASDSEKGGWDVWQSQLMQTAPLAATKDG